MTKYYYKYSSIDFTYLGKEEAYLDPEETKIAGTEVYSLPAFATFINPPKTENLEVVIFDIQTQKWKIEPDYRGMYQVNEDMQPEEILNFGELPQGYIPITKAQALKIEEDPIYYIIEDGQLVINPQYDEQKLAIAKEKKYQEALNGANDFINNEACFQFDENNSIEATDGNIAKFTAYAVGFSTGQLQQVYWTSKEDNVIVLNAEDVQNILFGLGSIQSDVWNIQFVAYKTAIDEAQTVAEVERILINYVN